MNLEFIKIDPEADEKMLIDKFEKETDTKVYDAQDTRILIQLMVYYANLVKTQMNDAANLNIVENSRAPFLDFLGKYKNCTRLEDESDESYIERILLSPEGFSVAGPELAYIYFAKAAHKDIVDAAVDCPKEDANVKINEIESILTSNTADNDLFSTNINYQTGEVQITLKQALTAGDVINVKIPHPYEVDIYTLTKDGAASEDILNCVAANLKDVRPLADFVVPKTAVIENFEISGTVYLTLTADEQTVVNNVNDILNVFLDEFKNRLNKSVVINQIIQRVCSIDGVYDFDLTSLTENKEAKKNTYYSGSIGTLTFERTNYD